MKVAVQFYGHLRSFKKTADNILENFIKPFGEVDVFIHTWDETDHSGKAWHNLKGEKRGEKLSQEDKKFILEKYSPKKFLAEPQLADVHNGLEYVLKLTDIPNKRATLDNIYYSRYKVNSLRNKYEKETGVKYDLVIQARLDLWFNKPFNLSKYLQINGVKGYTDKTFEIPNFDKKLFHCWEGNFAHNNINDLTLSSGTDVIYYGTSEVMDKVCELYKNLDNIDLEKYFYSCEYLLFHNAINQGILPVSINFYKDKDFIILRQGQTIEKPVLKKKRPFLKFFINLIPIKKLRKKLRKNIYD